MMDPVLDSPGEEIYSLRTTAPGPSGVLPFTAEFLRTRPSGTIFGWSQNAGMGWNPGAVAGKDFLILSTQGGIRAPDGTPVALGYHTGHWEVGLLMEEAARVISGAGGVPFAGFCSDPCDGRTNGTNGMLDSLPYRNDAAIIFRRLIRSLPTCRGVLGVATCDKGLPAMMMALAGMGGVPSVLVPGGVSLISEDSEDLAKIQTLGVRFANHEIGLEEAAELGCKTCASPGGGCQFLGTAATCQVIGEALGMTLPHAALSPSGSPLWKDMAARSAGALLKMESSGTVMGDILSDASLKNAMAVHAAFGGSTNLILHLPAIAHAAGLSRPEVQDWQKYNREVPRLVDSLPNGPRGFATVQVFLAGGVPEVMLHLRDMDLLDLSARSVCGRNLEEVLAWWESSERRRRFKEKLMQLDGIDPDEVIMNPSRAAAAGLSSTVTFPTGNLAPDGAVVKSTAISRSLLDDAEVYYHEGPARVFGSETEAIAAVKGEGGKPVKSGDVIILAGIGPLGCGMPETYQLTSALKYSRAGSGVALLTDGRFSGVSTGPCIGHISPEALAGGAIGKLRDGDLIRIRVDCRNLEGSIDLVAPDAEKLLAERAINPAFKPHPEAPADTRLWAALQNVSGGSWAGSVYDVDRIIEALERGTEAIAREAEDNGGQ
jgi:putative YjhG/YagF family dehydratase